MNTLVVKDVAMTRIVHVGISGWTYPGWRKGAFYPVGLASKNELSFASQQFSSIEINGTFYNLQTPQSFKKWYLTVPDRFVFSVKAGRYLTHIRRLKDPYQALCNFMASGILLLGDKLGPILWQFPPNVTWKDSRFSDFFAMLPMDTKAACQLAMHHSEKMQNRCDWTVTNHRPLDHVFEFRHESFFQEKFVALMNQYRLNFVSTDDGSGSVYWRPETGPVTYIRMHGQGPEQIVDGYSDKNLIALAEDLISRQKSTTQAGDIYVYFDNDAKAFAPRDAKRLNDILTDPKKNFVAG